MVANTIKSISCSLRLARSRAMRDAFAAILATVSFAGSINLRSLIPVRSMIQSLFVSMMVER
jgi:hypothetical protein